VYAWTLITLASILIVVYTATFIKVWMGTKYRVLLIQTAMMATANVCYLVQHILTLQGEKFCDPYQ